MDRTYRVVIAVAAGLAREAMTALQAALTDDHARALLCDLDAAEGAVQAAIIVRTAAELIARFPDMTIEMLHAVADANEWPVGDLVQTLPSGACRRQWRKHRTA
jgi:hypothetical protein